jgi:hypothetical protein
VPGIESLIEGSRKLIDIFGYWPSFHDAEITQLDFWRGEVDREQRHYVFPVLSVLLHVWELTNQKHEHGYFILRHHTLTKMRFHDVDEFKMEGFNHQNEILELYMERRERSKGPSPIFFIEFKPGYGMGASFICARLEVVDAVPCTKAGKAHA